MVARDTSLLPGADAAVLLRAEHAVGSVLAGAQDEAIAYPRVLAAIATSLDWQLGAVWEPASVDGGELQCVAAWRAGASEASAAVAVARASAVASAEELPARALSKRAPVWIDVGAELPPARIAACAREGIRFALAFPVCSRGRSVGALQLFADHARVPDDALHATLKSLGARIGEFAEACRLGRTLHENEIRKAAVLEAAFDCVVALDHRGRVLEVNHATEELFGHRRDEMLGRELAELVIPPAMREAHRRALASYAATRKPSGSGRREMTALRADGSEFPVELTVTCPDLPGPAVFYGYVRDITERRRSERSVHDLLEQQARLRRVATAVARTPDGAGIFDLVTGEVGALLGARTANMIRFEGDATAIVVGAWAAPGARHMAVGSLLRLDGDTVASRVWRTGRAARVDSYEGLVGSLAQQLRELGFRAAVGAPIKLGGELWGAVLVSTFDEPFPPGAEGRISDFCELVAQALANGQAREELAGSRARILEAGDAERRRLERNLHDGAQQRLVTLSLALRVAARRLVRDPEAVEVVERAGDELSAALLELREFARGIHPAVLTDHGLAPALEALSSRATVPVEVAVELEERLPPSIEAAAYYVAAEGLTNAAKYAQATVVRVLARIVGGSVSIELADDGVGGADPVLGSGLRGLADRVEAFGGHLDVQSPPGAGTTLRARIPLESPGRR